MLQLFQQLRWCWLLIILVSPASMAFDVVLTETEFRMLSSHCKRFYTVSQIGRSLPYTLKMPKDDFKAANLEAEKAGGAWHYCAGLVYMTRASYEPSLQKKQELYKKSIHEMAFSIGRITAEHWLYGEMLLNQAKAVYSLGDKFKSRTMLEQLLKQKPDYFQAKIELSRQYAKENNFQPAIAMLLAVPSEVKEKSADLNYALGVYYFKTGKFEDSHVYAKKAYQLKYPLPWLRTQLIKKGFTF